MPFEKGEGGRPKGAINKSTKLVKDVFAEAFAELQEDETTCLVTWGKENTTEFYKLASKLIPTQLTSDPDSPLIPTTIQLVVAASPSQPVSSEKDLNV